MARARRAGRAGCVRRGARYHVGAWDGPRLAPWRRLSMMDRGWWSYLRYDEQRDRPVVTRALMRRVLSYARPYSRKIALMLFIIALSTALALIPPLLQRSLI